MKILTAAEMKRVDRLSTERFHIPSLTLMENAGKSVAEFIRKRFGDLRERRIVVLCGKGNNGGDGFVVARHLLEMGARPEIFVLAAEGDIRGDAAANLARLRENSTMIRVLMHVPEWEPLRATLDAAEIVVDALLGTGTRGAVEGLLAAVISDVNRVTQRGNGGVVAVDIPSGMNADTGAAEGPMVVADYTITFTAPKPGLLLAGQPDRCGEIRVAGIGSPPELIEEIGRGSLRWSESTEFRKFSLRREAGGNKGDYGHALVVAGSVGKTGAAVLSSWSALRTGAGLVTVATPEPALPLVALHTPEIMTTPLAATLTGSVSEKSLDGNLFGKLLAGKGVLGIGPGLSTHPDTQAFIRGVLHKHRILPIVLDADGLNAFDDHVNELHRSGQTLCMTPHPGEMSRLVRRSIGEVQSCRVELALGAAADWNAFVVLKGQQTVVAAPDGRAYINSTGNPGMGTAGTGDVLTGMLAGLTAQFGAEDWLEVIAFGVFLHGLAGDIAYASGGEAPLMASDLIEAIPAAYKQFYAECGRG
jgi:ADP-dependent NAD(P)H-hydrate dehydratase / NAD(P)H-hydrate epimerase